MCETWWGGLFRLLNYQLIASYNFIAFSTVLWRIASAVPFFSLLFHMEFA